MLKPGEDYVQFAWKFRLFKHKNLIHNDDPLEIIDPGEQNNSSGPDFFNARIKLGKTIWAGNIEVHIRASDWFRHEHHKDPAYDSIILHVVLKNDEEIFRMNGEQIPALEMQLVQSHFEEYCKLVMNNQEVPCNHKIRNIDKVFLHDWISKMMIERLQDKTNKVIQTLEENKYDWEETFYRFLGKSFGFRINSLPFSMLAETVPLKVLLRLRDNPLSVNAILYGQAGFLEDIISGDKYYDALRKEYTSIRSILPQRILHAHSWQFMRSRPANFPSIRISQFASLVIKKFPLFADILECRKIPELREMFLLSTGKYWENHMLFGRTSRKRNYSMGRDSADIIIINAILPVLFAYAGFRKRTDIKDRVLRFLEELPPEKNIFVNKWKNSGIVPGNAFDSQALLHLTKNYCRARKCLECVIGSKIII